MKAYDPVIAVNVGQNQLSDNSRAKSCADIPYTPEEDADRKSVV